MAPCLRSCIGSAFCSHRQAACFLLATLIPFFLPFLILCVPFLLLFLAPISFLLFSLLLLYKLQVSVCSRRSRIPDKDALAENTLWEEDKEGGGWPVLPESEKLDCSKVQSLAATEDAHTISSSEFVGKEHDDVQELHVRHKMDEEHNVLEGMHATREEALPGFHREKDEEEGLQVLASPSTESFIHRTNEEQDDKVEEMPSDQDKKVTKPQEEKLILEGNGSYFTDENFLKTTSSDGRGEEICAHFPSSHEHGSLHSQSEEVPYIIHHSSSISTEEQHSDPSRDVPVVKSSVHESMGKSDEVLQNDEIDSLCTQEHDGQEPAVSFEKQLGSGDLDFGTGELKRKDVLFSVEKETEEGDPSCSSTDAIERWRAEELQDDVQPQQGSDSAELDHPFESPMQRPLEDVGNQEEHGILADIYAIKKIVGYQGEAHESVMEQITSLYLFLGMEPYYWDVEVDILERARAEVELLKVVVGVK